MNPVENSGPIGQQYNLKWTNHTNNILQMFSEQLLKEYLVDVTFSCEGQFIKAHKMVLSACSPYFQDLFKIHPADHPVIIMNGVQFATVKLMIDFMYQGEIKVGDADLDQLLTVAENLQIKGLCKIRREKNVSESTSFTSDVLQLQNSSTQSNSKTSTSTNPKGRKRRKQSNSPPDAGAQNSSSESQVNGNSASNPPEVPEKIPHISDTTKEDVDRSIQKLDPKLAKQSNSSKQPAQNVVTNSNDEKSPDRPSPKIPRPPNAFMIFANEWRKKLAVEHLGESNKEISVRLGNMWKALPASTKDWYYQAARKADEDHKVKYPGYYYSPKEARLRKELRGNNSRTISGPTSKSTDTSLKSVLEKRSESTINEELSIINEIKDEPEEFGLFEEPDNENSNSSAENGSTASTPKE